MDESSTSSNAVSANVPQASQSHHWDSVVRSFLMEAGLHQAARGLDEDMMTMNEDYERSHVLPAVAALRHKLSATLQPSGEPDQSLEERKLEHVSFIDAGAPSSRTSTTRALAALLARNRARNDASNRAEFLRAPSARAGAARTDLARVDRDVQMRFDVARNDDGPLRRTTSAPASASAAAGSAGTAPHAGLQARVRELETHIAVRFVPSPPPSLGTRLKLLEDHIIMLEKEYPPWAALHFNQPRRGWPPPPRTTAIIVPTSLLAASPGDIVAHEQEEQGAADEMDVDPAGVATAKGKSKVAGGGRQKSSLHRAVMEKLQVRNALRDLKGEGTSTE